MTFCIGMKVKGGLVSIVDTRVTSGGESTVARKIAVIEREPHAMFIMTSGLRSTRDKALTMVQHCYEDHELRHVGRWWQDRLIGPIEQLPSEWVQEAGKKLRS